MTGMNSTLISMLAILLVVLLRWRRSRRLRFPPGPRPLPIIGNALDMPTVRPWETYREWCNTHNSDLIFLQLPGAYSAVLGSVEVANDLLDKRSQVYSERPQSVMMELMGFSVLFSTISASDPAWQEQRKMFHQHFSHVNILEYRSVQLQHIRAFLSRTLTAKEDTRMNARLMIISIILSVTYGQVPGTKEYLAVSEKAAEGITMAFVPGKFWVEYLPFLKHIPSWVPGASARKLAEEYLPYSDTLKNKPYMEVKEAMENGTAVPSVARSLIEEIQEKYSGTSALAQYDDFAKHVSALAYFGGNETTASSVEWFLVAMVLFPDVQKKAQAVLDRVIGPTRLPEGDDLDQLPYIYAIMLETLRWWPVAPFGLPHSTLQDDEYHGYHIPKGTVVVSNIWGMLHDPKHYPDPEEFKPERFITSDGIIDSDLRDLVRMTVFGFGRRICPGRYFAEETLSVFIASTLHVFDISAGVDASGQAIELSSEAEGTTVAAARVVPHGLTPRSDAAIQLIREIETDY